MRALQRAQAQREAELNPAPKREAGDMSYLGGASSKDAYLGMELPYLGEGDVRVGFSEYDKVANARARDAKALAEKMDAPLKGTGVAPRPPPCTRRRSSP